MTARDRLPAWSALWLAGALCAATAPARAADEAEPAPKGATVTVLKASKFCFGNIVEVSGIVMPRDETRCGRSGSGSRSPR